MKRVSGDKRILIAEDDPISRKILKTTLVKRDFEVTVAKDGLEAWELLKKKGSPQLAILDWMMPNMDGLEVCNKVRSKWKSDKEYKYIIFLTTKGQKEDISKGLSAGADDYVTKPFDLQELMARIHVGLRIIGLKNSLEKHIEKLKELDQFKSDFISTVSHELRTPIAIMRGGVSLCLDGIAGELNSKQQDILNDTLENIDRLNRLVTDLLDVSKIEAGKLSIRRSSVDLKKIAEKIKRDFLSQISEKGLQFILDISEKPLLAYLDKDRIIQIFTNLVSNSIRFTEEGSITLKIEDDDRYIKCAVSDTGVGISKENIPKLFSKFEQFGRVEGPGYKGTGLGLTITEALVNKHGGTIRVDSEFGKGTCFHFTLEKIPFPTIMVVDDSEKIVDLIKRFLKIKGYNSFGVFNGRIAVEKAVTERPAAIIIDLMLPELNGYEVIEELKKNKKTADIPVIIVSGCEVDYDHIERINSKLKISVLEKPINYEKLTALVENIAVQK